MTRIGLTVALGLSALALTTPAPASAGCASGIAMGNDWAYCDGPINPDGTWTRCSALPPIPAIVNPQHCFVMGPGHSVPAGQDLINGGNHLDG